MIFLLKFSLFSFQGEKKLARLGKVRVMIPNRYYWKLGKHLINYSYIKERKKTPKHPFKHTLKDILHYKFYL